MISISGTLALETAFYGIPSITFADNDYPLISSIFKLKSKTDLPKLIQESLEFTSSNPDEVKKYFDILENNSFIFNLYEFQLAYFKKLYFDKAEVKWFLSEMIILILWLDIFFEIIAAIFA